MAYQSFEDLEVWKRSCTLAVEVYKTLRKSKDFGLRDQMQRAAVSIPSNIAEGPERTKYEFIRFLTIASRSSAELRTQTYIAAMIGLIDKKGNGAFCRTNQRHLEDAHRSDQVT